MKGRTDELLRSVAKLGQNALEEEKRNEIERRDVYLTNPTDALLYFIRKMFYRGRFDWLSEVYANATIQKVRDFIEQLGWQGLSSSINSLNEEKDPIGLKVFRPKGYKFPKADIVMVYDALRMVLDIPDKNVIRQTMECISTRKLGDMYQKVTSIHYIKDKLTCLFFRDVTLLYDLIEAITEDQVEYLLPVDTWVKQFCEKLGMVVSRKADNKTVKKVIIAECHRLSPPLQPIYFDQGLWAISQLPYVLKNMQLVYENINVLRIIADSGIFYPSSTNGPTSL